MAQDYPYELAGQWLKLFLAALPSVSGLVGRAAGATAEMLREAADAPRCLSRTQWELLREATGIEPSWVQPGNAAGLGAQLKCLQETMRQRRQRTPEALVKLRMQNMQRLTRTKGSVGRISQLVGVTYQAISLLNTGENAISTNRARDLERTLKLPAGWFDHEEPEIPAATLELLGAAELSAAGQRRLALAAAPVPAAEAAPASTPQLSSALHSAVLEKFVALSRANRINDQQAYELLGKLMEMEKSPSAPVAA